MTLHDTLIIANNLDSVRKYLQVLDVLTSEDENITKAKKLHSLSSGIAEEALAIGFNEALKTTKERIRKEYLNFKSVVDRYIDKLE